MEVELWSEYQKYLQTRQRRFNFKEREVWWMSFGCNIGDEENGKGARFERPVLILKKFNQNLFWGIALTSRHKTGRFYLPVSSHTGWHSTLILSQLRLCDARRLQNKITSLPQDQFRRVRQHIRSLI